MFSRLSALFLILAATPALATDVKVEIHGAASTRGSVLVALFDGPAQFPGKPDNGLKLSAAGPLVAVFHNVKPGTYAISAFHDENDNGVLDANLLGMPTERYGFSRDAVGNMGPPKFDAASFVVGKDDQTLVVTLH